LTVEPWENNLAANPGSEKSNGDAERKRPAEAGRLRDC